jgi:hypothetical protein
MRPCFSLVKGAFLVVCLAGCAAGDELQPGYQGSSYTQSNDYSFDAALTTNGGTESTKLTGYLSGVLAWGIEPDGAGPEPSGNDP